MKKKIITFLAITASLCFCFAYACGEILPQAKFVDNPVTEVFLSDEIDLEEYVVLKRGYDYKITVSYDQTELGGEVVSKEETFGGMNMVFYPKTTGEHTVKYELTDGKKSTFATLVITVSEDAPRINFAKTALNYELKYNEQTDKEECTINYGVMMAEASMSVKPIAAETQVVKIEKRSLVAEFDSEGEWQNVDFDKDASYNTFTEVGQYKITVKATSGGKTSEDFFLVNILKRTSDGNSVFSKGKNVVFNESDEYVVKLPSAPITNLSYVVIKEEFGKDDSLNVVFKGKSAPQLGLYVNSEDNSYNVSASKGAFFSFVAKSSQPWVYYTPDMFGATNAKKTPVSGRADYFGLSDFEDDKYYLMTFTAADTTFGIDVYEAKITDDGCERGERLFSNSGFGGYGSCGMTLSGKAVIYGNLTNDAVVKYIPEDKITEEPKVEDEIKSGDKTLGYGYKASVEEKDDSISVNLAKGTVISYAKQGTSDRLSYFGVTDVYGVGKTISVTFNGKNLPNIGLFLSNSPAGYVIGGATGSGNGILFSNGSLTNDPSLQGRLVCYAPSRFNDGSAATMPEVKQRIDELSYFGTNPDDKTFAEMGYKNLDDDKNYKLDIQTISFGDNLELVIRFYEKVGGEYEEKIKPLTLKVSATELGGVDKSSKTIAFFGSTLRDIEFSYSVSDAYSVAVENSYGVSANEEGEMRFDASKASRTDEEGYRGTYSYVGMGSYSVGETLRISFSGKNIPNVGLFTSANGIQPIASGGTGLYIQTSSNEATWHKRLNISGPYILDPGKNESNKNGYSNELGKNKQLAYDTSNTGGTSLFGFGMLNSSKSYVYEITTEAVANDSSKVTIILKLYSVNGNEFSKVAIISKTVTHGLDSLQNRYVTIYGAICPASESLSVIKLKAEKNPTDTITPTEKKPTSTYNKTTGEAKLDKCYGGDAYTDISNIDLGSYANGGAVALEFTGKWSPQVAFFVSGGITEAPAAKTYNGILFSGEAVTDHYRIYSGFITDNNAFAHSKTSGFVSTFAGRNSLDESKTYVLVLSAIKNTNYDLTITLYEKGDDGELSSLGTASYERTIGQSVGGDHIVLFGSKEKDLTFKVSVSDNVDGALSGYTIKSEG